MKRSTDRILTTHVGSIVRKPELLASARAAGQSAELQSRHESDLTQSIAEVVKLQAEAGIDVV